MKIASSSEIVVVFGQHCVSYFREGINILYQHKMLNKEDVVPYLEDKDAPIKFVVMPLEKPFPFSIEDAKLYTYDYNKSEDAWRFLMTLYGFNHGGIHTIIDDSVRRGNKIKGEELLRASLHISEPFYKIENPTAFTTILPDSHINFLGIAMASNHYNVRIDSGVFERNLKPVPIEDNGFTIKLNEFPTPTEEFTVVDYDEVEATKRVTLNNKVTQDDSLDIIPSTDETLTSEEAKRRMDKINRRIDALEKDIKKKRRWWG